MKGLKIGGAILIFLILFPIPRSWADGGYFSSRSVSVSADQRAIIIKNGDEISMTFSTGYSGEGEDFAWIIPTPVPPAIEHVSEAGEIGETAFELLDELTAPYIVTPGGGWGANEEPAITVHRTVTLKHYEVSILGARAAAPLLNWLRSNGYNVGPESVTVLDKYISENWAFVAVKLNPGEKRHYENEFLPPLTVRYCCERLVFPLRISSVSTAETVRISLFVIAESTISSSNLGTTTLLLKNKLLGSEDPEEFLENSLQRAAGGSGRGVVALWKGEYPDSSEFREILEEFMVNPHTGGAKPLYLTRLDTMMDPYAMTEDIELVLDPAPRLFGPVGLNVRVWEPPGSSTPRQLSDLSRVKLIAVGESNTQEPPMTVLEDDGTVWTWKHPRGNRYGRLGQPVKVSGLSGIIALAAGSGHTLAVKDDGTVLAWGWNGNGQLGDGSTVDSHTPVQVRGLSGVAAVAAKGRFSVALKDDGTVWAWGWNDYGQLGDGSTTPVQVRGLSGMTAIAVEDGYHVGLKSDGTVWLWGKETPYAVTVNRITTPVQVRGLSGVVAVAAGDSHTVALKSDGSVWSWGSNRRGELGDDSRAHSLGPVHVSNISGVVAITAGNGYTAALKNDGTVWVWGRYW